MAKKDDALTAPSDVKTALATAATADSTDIRGKDFDMADVQWPRLALAQKTSPQIDPGKPDAYIDGLRQTQMFNTLTHENYGNGPLRFAVIRTSKHAMEFDADSKVVRRHVPLDDKALQFTTDANGKSVKPKATLFQNYLILLEDGSIAVLSMKGTQHKVASHLNSLLLFRKGAAWDGLFSVTSMSKTHGPFTAATMVIAPAGPTPEALRQEAERWYDRTANFAERMQEETVSQEPLEKDSDPDGIPF